MAVGYKLSEWNKVIQDVNEALADCLDPIPLAEGPNHRIAKSDLRQIHDAIKSICPDAVFSSLDPTPLRFKRSQIDEIYDALEDCNCDDDCTSEDGTIVVIDDLTRHVSVYCGGEEPETQTMAEYLNGIVVGAPGIIGRSFTFVNEQYGSSTDPDTTGPGCTGILDVNGAIIVIIGASSIAPTNPGIAVFCEDCGSEACGEAIDEANEQLPTAHNYHNYVVIGASNAECV